MPFVNQVYINIMKRKNKQFPNVIKNKLIKNLLQFKKLKIKSKEHEEPELKDQ